MGGRWLAMTPEDRRGLQWLMGEVATLTKQHVAEKIKQAVEPLEARIAALERREYKGIWTGTETYAKGAMVTHNGGLWIARSDSLSVRPGTSPAWQLCVRRGRDGKDVRSDATLQR